MINLKRWVPTFLAFPLGGLLAMLLVGSLDDPLTGAAGGLLAASRRVAVAWTAITAASWSVAWLVSWAVIGINADQGFYVFGSSGAVVATVLTGLALRNLTGVKQVAA